MKLPRARANAPQIPVGDDGLFMPTSLRPVRVRSRTIPVDSHFEPHHHAWAQLACCVTGVLQLTVAQNAPAPGPADGGGPAQSPIQTTYIVPPSRAVWIPPGDLHAINVLETAEFRTLYIHPGVVPAGWRSARVIVVSGLIRELIQALDAPADLQDAATQDASATRERERLLTTLLLDEITHATTQALGVPMPSPHHGDKRLRVLCNAVMRAPGERATLAEWAADIGASERTLQRWIDQTQKRSRMLSLK